MESITEFKESTEIKLLNGDIFKGNIEKEDNNILKLRLDDKSIIVLNKRFIKEVK